MQKHGLLFMVYYVFAVATVTTSSWCITVCVFYLFINTETFLLKSPVLLCCFSLSLGLMVYQITQQFILPLYIKGRRVLFEKILFLSIKSVPKLSFWSLRALHKYSFMFEFVTGSSFFISSEKDTRQTEATKTEYTNKLLIYLKKTN